MWCQNFSTEESHNVIWRYRQAATDKHKIGHVESISFVKDWCSIMSRELDENHHFDGAKWKFSKAWKV